MAAIADRFERLGVATPRYQFPSMEKGGKHPDSPAVAHAAVRAAVAEAKKRADGRPLFAGGRSFGGRMTSQAQALDPLPGVRGLAFFAFPLHPAGKPSVIRADDLPQVAVPRLFLQDRMTPWPTCSSCSTVATLEGVATLELIADANHAFHVPAKTGRKAPMCWLRHWGQPRNGWPLGAQHRCRTDRLRRCHAAVKALTPAKGSTP